MVGEVVLSQNPLCEVESVEIAVKRSVVNKGELEYISKLPVEIFKFTKGGEV